VSLQIEDDGAGIPPQAIPGKGLANMRHRAERIGAGLSIDSDSRGTRITILLQTGVAGQDRTVTG
jgi:signal transduction histidine kinase